MRTGRYMRPGDNEYHVHVSQPGVLGSDTIIRAFAKDEKEAMKCAIASEHYVNPSAARASVLTKRTAFRLVSEDFVRAGQGIPTAWTEGTWV